MHKNWGHFEGHCDVRILPPPAKRRWWEWVFPRRPQLIVLSKFSYIDPNGKRWQVEPGDPVNGLSTPCLFWRLMPPFAWREVRGSVIHDPECEVQVSPSPEVHTMIYAAARCDNASPLRAWLMWFGVRFFGPRFPGIEKGSHTDDGW